MNTNKFLKLVFQIVGITSIIFAVILVRFFFFANDSFGVLEVSNTDKVAEHEKINILVLGVDHSGLNSDVMMLFSLDQKNRSIHIVSIPRDTRIKLGNNTHKINASYLIGQEELAVKTVKNLLGVKVHHFATINLEAFKDIVDALGGVHFEVPHDMNKDDDSQELHIHLEKGMQLLDGDKALQLVRYRGYPNADHGRNKIQQEFLKELFNQKMKLKYITKISKVYKSAAKNTKTDLTLATVTKYVALAKAIPSENISAYELPGQDTIVGGTWYFLHDEDATKKLMSEKF